MFQYSDAVENASLDARETAIGASPVLEIRTGATPATCAAADSGGLLVSIALPADWMAAAAGRSKSKAGAWAANATGAGVGGHFRIKQGATAHIQGPCTEGAVQVSGELVLINTDIAVGQPVSVNLFDLIGAAA